jgi:hypothetical protein
MVVDLGDLESLPDDEYPLVVCLAGYLTVWDATGRFELDTPLEGLEKGWRRAKPRRSLAISQVTPRADV